ncbi:putative protein C8orf76-like [Crotalus adamanteus]|uniref:Uncharacterized protein n=1 Tax=Crotalus adamanteus TaxID=8729 RepID=A0AAW1BM90_CROAD
MGRAAQPHLKTVASQSVDLHMNRCLFLAEKGLLKRTRKLEAADESPPSRVQRSLRDCRSPARRMALLPFVFEDSVFEEGGGASRAGSPLASHYSARCCEPEWFCEQVDCQDDLERINIKKFRGDLAYKQQEFQKALQEYSSCLALVPSSNTAMRRDLKESQARCLAHLGKHEEALRIAENLRNGATNTDHVTAVLNLQARLLLQLMQLTQSSFALENNLRTQQDIEDKIRFFELEADSLSLMTEVMGEDLVPEKLKGDAQEEVKCLSSAALPSIRTASTVEFERKWFQKLKDCSSHMDCLT